MPNSPAPLPGVGVEDGGAGGGHTCPSLEINSGKLEIIRAYVKVCGD